MTLSEIDELCYVEMELDRSYSGLKMYINIFSIPLSSEEPSVSIGLTIDEQTHQSNGTVLKGGQRILLNESAQDIIIKALLDGKNVHLSFSRYRACIIPDRFAENYAQLLSIEI